MVLVLTLVWDIIFLTSCILGFYLRQFETTFYSPTHTMKTSIT